MSFSLLNHRSFFFQVGNSNKTLTWHSITSWMVHDGILGSWLIVAPKAGSDFYTPDHWHRNLKIGQLKKKIIFQTFKIPLFIGKMVVYHLVYPLFKGPSEGWTARVPSVDIKKVHYCLPRCFQLWNFKNRSFWYHHLLHTHIGIRWDDCAPREIHTFATQVSTKTSGDLPWILGQDEHGMGN